MQYFILPKDDWNIDLMNENYLLGEESFKVFWAGDGFTRLHRIIERAPDVLESIQIIDSKGKKFTIEQFLDKVAKLKIRRR